MHFLHFCDTKLGIGLFLKNSPEGLINSEEWDWGYHGIASTLLAGSFDGHSNSPFETFLQIWLSSFGFREIIIGF